MTSQQIFSVWTKLKTKLYCIPTQVKPQKVSVSLCYYGLKFSRSIRQSVRRGMDRLSANQILAFYPYFVRYTITPTITPFQIRVEQNTSKISQILGKNNNDNVVNYVKTEKEE